MRGKLEDRRKHPVQVYPHPDLRSEAAEVAPEREARDCAAAPARHCNHVDRPAAPWRLRRGTAERLCTSEGKGTHRQSREIARAPATARLRLLADLLKCVKVPPAAQRGGPADGNEVRPTAGGMQRSPEIGEEALAPLLDIFLLRHELDLGALGVDGSGAVASTERQH